MRAAARADRRRAGPLRLPRHLLRPAAQNARAPHARRRSLWIRAHGTDVSAPGGPASGHALPAAAAASAREAQTPRVAPSRARTSRACRAARAAGRLALDTEFMGEGRYRTLLCLIQLAVPGRTAPRAGARVRSRSPTRSSEDFDGAALAAVLADPAVQIVVHAGRQDIALMRRALAHRGLQRVRHAGRGRLRRPRARRAPMTRCCQRRSGCGWPRARASRAGTRGRSRHEQLALCARGRGAPARAGRRARTPADGARPPGVGARGVRAARARRATSATRRRSTRGCRGFATSSPGRAAGRARAGGVARADRGAARPARAERPVRRRAGGDRKAQPVIARRAGEDPRRRRRAAPGAGPPRCSRPSSAGSAATPEEPPHEQRPPAPRPGGRAADPARRGAAARARARGRPRL